MKPHTKHPSKSPTQPFYLAGVQYSDYLKVGSWLTGTELLKQFEDDNPHDKKAISVWLDTMRIGYIPKGWVQTLLHERKVKGLATELVLVAYHTKEAPWNRVEVRLRFPEGTPMATDPCIPGKEEQLDQ